MINSFALLVSTGHSGYFYILATTYPPITPSKVTISSLVALSPWNILLSWKAPDGIDPLYVKYYEVTGSVVYNFNSSTVYNALPISLGILPSSIYVVIMRVMYIDGQISEPISLSVTTPHERKLNVIGLV